MARVGELERRVALLASALEKAAEGGIKIGETLQATATAADARLSALESEVARLSARKRA
jgi:hypothetical protein